MGELLLIAAELGLIGLAAYLAFTAGVVALARAALRAAEGTSWRGAAVGACGIIGAVATHELFENLHALSLGVHLAVVWAVLEIIARMRHKVTA